MINLLLGAPGGGKSYEAVVYHILPALRRGRVVVTNLPVVVPMIEAVEPGCEGLLRVVTRSTVGGQQPFSQVSDYIQQGAGDGVGPLYVIDECHRSLPRGETPRDVDEWYAEHRHTGADVLLITQSYGKVSRPIIELVQVCYRVRKAVALGFSRRYIRKVQDGIRGDVVNTAVREYEKKYFPLYLSHTRGGSGLEASAEDIVPLWKRWPFIGMGVCFALLVAILVARPSALNPFNSVKAKPSRAVRSSPVHVAPPVARNAVRSAVPDVGAAGVSRGRVEPYANRGLHLAAVVHGAHGRRAVLFGVSQNGQLIGYIKETELVAAGYTLELAGDCTGWLRFGAVTRSVVCDLPQTSAAVPLFSGSSTGGAGAGGAPARGEGPEPATSGPSVPAAPALPM